MVRRGPSKPVTFSCARGWLWSTLGPRSIMLASEQVVHTCSRVVLAALRPAHSDDTRPATHVAWCRLLCGQVLISEETRMNTQAIPATPRPGLAPPRVWVCRQPATEAALYDLADLRALTWTQMSGGRRQVVADYFISAVVQCDGAIQGEVGHSGSHGHCPHQIRVVVVASHNDKAIMSGLRNQVGPKPRRVTNADLALACIVSAGPDGVGQSPLYRPSAGVVRTAGTPRRLTAW